MKLAWAEYGMTVDEEGDISPASQEMRLLAWSRSLPELGISLEQLRPWNQQLSIGLGHISHWNDWPPKFRGGVLFRRVKTARGHLYFLNYTHGMLESSQNRNSRYYTRALWLMLPERWFLEEDPPKSYDDNDEQTQWFQETEKLEDRVYQATRQLSFGADWAQEAGATLAPFQRQRLPWLIHTARRLAAAMHLLLSKKPCRFELLATEDLTASLIPADESTILSILPNNHTFELIRSFGNSEDSIMLAGQVDPGFNRSSYLVRILIGAFDLAILPKLADGGVCIFPEFKQAKNFAWSVLMPGDHLKSLPSALTLSVEKAAVSTSNRAPLIEYNSAHTGGQHKLVRLIATGTRLFEERRTLSADALAKLGKLTQKQLLYGLIVAGLLALLLIISLRWLVR